MAYRLLTIQYYGDIKDDKSFDNLKSTINTALSSVKEPSSTVNIYKNGNGVVIQVSVDNQYKISQVDTFIKGMISSDFTTVAYDYSFNNN